MKQPICLSLKNKDFHPFSSKQKKNPSRFAKIVCYDIYNESLRT